MLAQGESRNNNTQNGQHNQHPSHEHSRIIKLHGAPGVSPGHDAADTLYPS
jgi:hypothetical protein